MRCRRIALLVLAVPWLFALGATAQQPYAAEPSSSEQQARIEKLEKRVEDLEKDSSKVAGGGGLSVLFGAFCALWAQNTGRRPWLWFFLGLFFSIIAVCVLLYKNSQDIKARGAARSAQVPGPEAAGCLDRSATLADRSADRGGASSHQRRDIGAT